MPRLSILMVRSALLHLAVGFFIGALILWQKGAGGIPGAWRWLPVHIHLLLIGWLVQLALGVAFWILPRFTVRDEGGRVQQRRGREPLAWLSFLLLNGSTLAALATPLLGRAALAASGVAVALAGASFMAHLWPRIKAFSVG